MNSNITSITDYTLLEPTATLKDVQRLCKEAVENNYLAVCLLPLFVKKAKELTKNSSVKVATVIGYPFGISIIEAKLAEIIMAIVDEADEFEMVINITALKNEDWQYLAREINSIIPVIKNKGKILKLVVESSFFTKAELIKCCDIYGAAGVDFISLSTGIEQEAPSLETVKLMRKHLADQVGIKINGTIASEETTAGFIKAGVSRIGKRFTVVK